MSEYLRLSKRCEERRLRRYALTGRNGGDPERPACPDSDVAVIRKSSERLQDAMDRLFSSIDDALR